MEFFTILYQQPKKKKVPVLARATDLNGRKIGVYIIQWYQGQLYAEARVCLVLLTCPSGRSKWNAVATS